MKARQNQRENLLSVVNESKSRFRTTPGSLQGQSQTLSLVVGKPTELSLNARGGAVDLANNLAGAGPSNVNNASSQAIVGSLSFVSVAENNTLTAVSKQTPGASAGRRRLLAEAAAASCAGLKNVVGAVDTLSNTHLGGVDVPGEDPVSVSSAKIQMASQKDDPSSGSSRMFSNSIAAPGSGGSFDPLPTNVLGDSNNSEPVGIKFLSTAFDFRSCSNSNPGVTRLELGGSNGTLAVSGLLTPITFTLPPPIGLNATTEAPQCTYWSITAKAYVTDGCISMPSMVPRGFTVQWNSSLKTPDDLTLARGWYLDWAPTSALLTSQADPRTNCTVDYLDCVNNPDRVVFLDKLRPLSIPSAKCENASQGVLRVYTGAACPLWMRPAAVSWALAYPKVADLGCYWDFTKQAFKGPACVSVGPPRCACRHLTDYTTNPAIQLSIISPAQLMSLSPMDILVKAKIFLIVIASIFGSMLVGAGVLAAWDAVDRRSMLKELLTPAFGYKELDGGVWTWNLFQVPLSDELGAVRGPIVNLALLAGVPFVRFRAALPDELLSGSVGNVLGRKNGLSLVALAASKKAQEEMVGTLFGMRAQVAHGGGTCCLSKQYEEEGTQQAKKAADAREADDAREAAAMARPGDQSIPVTPRTPKLKLLGTLDKDFAEPETPPLTEDLFTGTALVLAFIFARGLLNIRQVGELQAKASEHFKYAAPTMQLTFDELVNRLKILMFKENINMRKKWWRKARLWRFVFTQSKEGWWDPSDSVAMGLQATLVPPKRRSTAKKALIGIWKVLQTVVVFITSGGDDVDGLGNLTRLKEDEHGPPPKVANDDCPLTFHPEAIEYTQPKELRALLEDRDRIVDTQGAETVEKYFIRIWTTALALRVLEGLEVSWLCDGDEELTIVDFAQAWLDAQVEANPFLADAMPVVLEKAAYRVAVWEIVQDERITPVRVATNLFKFHVVELVQRFAAFVAHALRIRHETVSAFIGPLLFEGFRKWQRWVLISTFLLLAMVIEVWFYQNKGFNCCIEVRSILNDGTDNACPVYDFAAPCLEYVGDCGDLPDQFNDIIVEKIKMDEYVCNQFPNEDNVRDRIVVGLIVIAFNYPLTWIVETMFDMSNTEGYPEFWLYWPFIAKMKYRILGFKKHSWHWGNPETKPSWLIRFCNTHDGDWSPLEVALEWYQIGLEWFAEKKEEWQETRAEALESPREKSNIAERDSGPWAASGSTGQHGRTLTVRMSAVDGITENRATYDHHAHVSRMTVNAPAPARPRRQVDRRTRSMLSQDEIAEREAEIEQNLEEAEEGEKCAWTLHYLALFGVATVWAILTWFCFAYGKLIYDQLGAGAEDSFVRDWLIAWGMENASAMQEMFKELGQAILIILILDKLWFQKNEFWMEEHLDFLSVQATMLGRDDLNFIQRTLMHMRHISYIAGL